MSEPLWAWVRVDVDAAAGTIRSIYDGPMSRDDAYTAVLAKLNATPGAQPLILAWLGGPKDHTVSGSTPSGMSAWAILPVPEDARRAVTAWVQDFADIIRTQDIAVAIDPPQRD